MAKQIINFGTTANDGTGDPLRTAFQKTKENFDELYDGLFDGDYNSLTNKPSIPTDLLDLGILDGTSGQVLTTNGSGTFTFTTSAGGGVNLSAFSAANANTASGVGSLTYDNGTGVFTYTPPVLPADLTDLGIADGTVGQVLTTDGDGAFSFEDAPEGLKSRSNATGTTSVIANNTSANLDITGFKAYALLAITVDRAAWVRIYANSASRSADSARAETSDPAPDAGVIAEVITTGAGTILVSPSTIGYNFEGTPNTTIPCAVKNKSGATSAVSVTLNILQLEA